MIWRFDFELEAIFEAATTAAQKVTEKLSASFFKVQSKSLLHSLEQ